MARKYNPLSKLGLDLYGATPAEQTELSGKMNITGNNYTEDKELASPIMSGTWTITKQDGTTPTVSSSASKNINIEKGAKVHLSAKWHWTAATNKKNPTSTSGFFGTELSASDVEITKAQDNITSTTTFSVSVSANKTGLIVVSNKVKKASGVDTNTDSMSVTFKDRMYWGAINDDTIVNDNVVDFSALNSELVTTRICTKNFNCAGGKFIFFAFPTSLCTSIRFNIGGLDYSAMVLTTKNYTNEYGSEISYNIYRVESKQNGANITIKTT